MTYYVLRATGCDGDARDVLAVERPKSLSRGDHTSGKPLGRAVTRLRCTYDRELSKGARLLDVVPNACAMFPMSARLRELFAREPNIEWLPVEIIGPDGTPVARDYALANFLAPVACVDAKRSKPYRLLDRITDFEKLALDPRKLPPGRHAFPLATCPKVVVVDDELRTAIEEAGVEGLGFIPVGDYSCQDETAYFMGTKVIAARPTAAAASRAPATPKPPAASKVKVATRFGGRMSFEATVRALAELFAAVVRAVAGTDTPLRSLALGITSDSGRPILQLVTASGHETSFGYVWSFPGCDHLATKLEAFAIKGAGDADADLKLAAAMLVAYAWWRDEARRPVPFKGTPAVHAGWDEPPCTGVATALEGDELDDVLAAACEQRASRAHVAAVLGIDAKQPLAAIGKLGLDRWLDGVLRG